MKECSSGQDFREYNSKETHGFMLKGHSFSTYFLFGKYVEFNPLANHGKWTGLIGGDEDSLQAKVKLHVKKRLIDWFLCSTLVSF